MKKRILLLIAAAMTASLVGCHDDDGYSIDDFWIGMGTATKLSAESQPFYIQFDNGDKDWIAATNLPHYNPKDGQRIIANYTILSDKMSGYDHAIKLNNVYEVLTKPVITETTANSDSIGKDKILIRSAWIASDYLNIKFEFLGNSKRHMVNLVTNETFGSTPELAKIQFRQNGYGDEERYRMQGIVSFNIASLKVAGVQTRNIELKYTDLDGVEKKIDLKYDWSGLVKIDTPVPFDQNNYSVIK